MSDCGFEMWDVPYSYCLLNSDYWLLDIASNLKALSLSKGRSSNLQLSALCSMPI